MPQMSQVLRECNWHADCRNVHQSCCSWIECSFLYHKPSPKMFQRTLAVHPTGLTTADHVLPHQTRTSTSSICTAKIVWDQPPGQLREEQKKSVAAESKRKILNNADQSTRIRNNKLGLKCQVPKCEQEGPLLLHLGCSTATFLGCWRRKVVFLGNGCFEQGINHAGTMKAGLSTAPELCKKAALFSLKYFIAFYFYMLTFYTLTGMDPVDLFMPLLKLA